MRMFLDTEFIEDGRTIDLISIGVVAENGREFYREVDPAEVNWAKANDWVKTNVWPHLTMTSETLRLKADIATELVHFAGERPEFWGYYADYDWVVLCQLFGRMIDLPKGWPMFCLDLKQLAVMFGNPKLPEQTSTEHHALADARWNRDVYQFLAGSDMAARFAKSIEKILDGR
jgi:3' exoribonuclease, RNase T-like